MVLPTGEVGLSFQRWINLYIVSRGKKRMIVYRKEQCIQQLFEAQVERTPDATAVVFEGKELTYRELNRRANQLACYLRGLGVDSEVLVGLCLERSLEMIVALLGILKA